MSSWANDSTTEDLLLRESGDMDKVTKTLVLARLIQGVQAVKMNRISIIKSIQKKENNKGGGGGGV